MDVIHLVHDARRVVEVLDGGIFVFFGIHVDQMHGRARGAEVDPVSAEVEVILRVLSVQGHVLVGDGKRVLDQSAREPQATVVAQNSPGSNH